MTSIGDPRLPARFWRKVTQDANGCWLWGGSLTRGYGSFMLADQRTAKAHRVAYEALAGPIPSGLQIDHLCRVRNCVRPSHLEPVTQQENLRRARPVLTHCPQNHEYTAENTYVSPVGDRRCRECQRVRNAAAPSSWTPRQHALRLARQARYDAKHRAA